MNLIHICIAIGVIHACAVPATTSERCTSSAADASALLQGALRVEAPSVRTIVEGSHATGDATKPIDGSLIMQSLTVSDFTHFGAEVSASRFNKVGLGGLLLVLLLVTGVITAKILRPESNVVTIVFLAVTYNCVSTSMIETNKWLMHSDRFPYPVAMTATHMLVSWIFATCLYACCPSFFPAMKQLEVTRWFCAKFLLVGVFFASSLVCCNAAYLYLSLPFVQVVKHCNIAIVYILSIVCGLDALKRCSVVLLACILFGVSLTVQGELHFQLGGFLLQVAGSLAEASRVVCIGILMAGATKLDPMSMLLFMAPACLLVSLVPFLALEASKIPEILHQITLHLPMLLVNASLAFTLNAVAAVCIKLMSPVGYVVMGTMKDIIIIGTSGFFLGETLTLHQIEGFSLALCGVFAYSFYKHNLDCFAEDQLFKGFWQAISGASQGLQADQAPPGSSMYRSGSPAPAKPTGSMYRSGSPPHNRLSLNAGPNPMGSMYRAGSPRSPSDECASSVKA